MLVRFLLVPPSWHLAPLASAPSPRLAKVVGALFIFSLLRLSLSVVAIAVYAYRLFLRALHYVLLPRVAHVCLSFLSSSGFLLHTVASLRPLLPVAVATLLADLFLSPPLLLPVLFSLFSFFSRVALLFFSVVHQASHRAVVVTLPLALIANVPFLQHPKLPRLRRWLTLLLWLYI